MTTFKVGDLIYYIADDGKKYYTIIKEISKDTRLWGNWYNDIEEAINDKATKYLSYMDPKDCFLEHPKKINDWRKELE